MRWQRGGVDKASVSSLGVLTAVGLNASFAGSSGGVQFGGTAVLYESGATMYLRSRATATGTTASTPAIALLPFGSLDADDLILDVQSSAGASRLLTTARRASRTTVLRS